jgi:hypothetical protein
MKTLVIAAAIAIAVAGGARAEDRNAATYYFACKSTDDLVAVLQSAGRTDDEAFRKIAARVFPKNQCTLLKPGQRVIVERTNASGQHCVRTVYDPECFWTEEAAFHPKAEGR